MASFYELFQYAFLGAFVGGMARSMTGVPFYYKPRIYGYGAVAGLGAWYIISSINESLEHSKEERFVKLMAERSSSNESKF